MSGQYPISNAERLLMRLSHAVTSGQRVTFLIGSGLTCPSPDGAERGVPSVAAMVERARALFPVPEECQQLDEAVQSAQEGAKYQAAMQFVIECRGQTALNGLIRDAVLECRTGPCDKDSLEALEREIDGWHLRPGVEALGCLIQKYPSIFRHPILTSNFDPLIEIALRHAGRNAITINLPNDGNFNDIVLNDTSVPVVHFHGFWRQGDTLHTPDRLTRERPLLTGNLRQLLQEAVLVVIGYGGWGDVFSLSLLKAIREQGPGLNVLWAFYSSDTNEIVQRNSELLNSFQSLPGQRVVAYAGVDCHELFPKLLAKLKSVKAVEAKVEAVHSPKHASLAIHGSSSPPATDAWVGRESELANILNTNCSVIALYGLGGFGKSSLAAKYVKTTESKRSFEGWYWADCREQGNTIQMHLIRLLTYLSRGQITSDSLQKSTDSDILELLFEQLSDRSVLIVFDNIDHYVDLETQSAIALLHSLIERMLRTSSKAQLLLTTRPVLQYSSPQFLCLPVAGLSQKDADELFKLRNAQWDPERKSQQLSDLMRITQGSALHLNLIATQIAKQSIQLSDLLDRIENGTAPESEDRILHEIWDTLKQEHQNVLRVLAEMPHPETEERIAACLRDSMQFNRLHKAVKALQSLNLIVVKPSMGAPNGLELHPLVRAFIRRRFPKDERAPMVNRVLEFFNLMMGRMRGRPEMETLDVLVNWTTTIEICVENGKIGSALEVMNEVTPKLLTHGYVEEFLRLASMVLKQYVARDNPAELQIFDRVSEDLVEVLGNLGRYHDADEWIERLSATVTGKSARYIWLCHLRAYASWIRNQFDEAKRWSSEGVELKRSTNIDTIYDCAHSLALAQRDSGEVEIALVHFLGGTKIEEVTKANSLDERRGGEFYGNIGRCLQFLKRYDDALICLRKSATLLERSHGTNALLNQGWAAHWLGEVLKSKGLIDESYLSFRCAAVKWMLVSPTRCQAALRDAASLVEKLKDNSLPFSSNSECEAMYRNWLRV